jgi:TP901 family phage tail tape measure protein
MTRVGEEMPKEENVTTKFKVDISDLKKNISAANAAVRQYRAELKNADAGMEKGEKTVDSLTKKIEAQSKIVEQEQAKLDALKDELKRYEETVQKGETIIADLTEKHKKAAEQFGENSDEAKKYAKELRDAQAAQERNTKKVDELRTAIINQDTVLKNSQHQVEVYKNDLDELGKEEEKVGEEAQKTTDGGLSAFGVALGNLAANAITAVIDKLGELAAAAVNAFESFDEGRDNLIKATGAVGDAADEITAAYSKTAKSVRGDLGDIGSAVGEVNTRFGFTGDKLSSVTEDFVKFADITGTDATQAVRLVARAMGDAGIDADNYAELLDQLAIAAQASGISVDTLTENLTKYGAPMRALGFDTAESIALFSSWEKAGVNTETAFSGMRKAISNWSKDGKDAREEFKKTLDEIAATPDIATATTKAIEAFGAKAGPDLADAIKGGRFEYSEMLKVLENSSGTVENTYEETQSGIDKIQLAVQRLSVTFGEAAGKLIDEYAPKIEHIISLFTDLINGTDGAVTRLADSISGLLLDALDDVSNALPKIFDFGSKVVEQLTNGIITAAPKLIDSAGDVLEKLIDGLTAELPKIITGLAKIAAKILDKLAELLPNLVKSLIKAIPKIINALSEALPLLIQAATTFVKEIVNALPELVQMIAAELPDIIKTIADTITEQLPVLLDAAFEIFNAIVEAIPQILPPLVEALPQIIDTIIKFLTDNTQTLLEAFIKAFKVGLQAIPVLVENLVPLLPDIIDAVVHGLLDAAPEIFEAAKTVFFEIANAITDFAKELPEYVYRLLEPIYDNFIDPLKEGLSEFWNWFKNLEFFDVVGDTIGDIVDKFSEGIGKIKGFFTGLWESIKETFHSIGEFFGGIWDDIKKTFTTIGTKVGDAIGGAFKTAINAVLETVENAINTVPDAINGAIDLLNELPGVDIGSMDYISLPRLAKGGIVDRSTLAMVGENGREAILPLENNKAALKEIAALIADEMNIGTATQRINAQPVVNNYNFNQTNNSPKALSRWDIYRQTKNLISNLKNEGAIPNV